MVSVVSGAFSRKGHTSNSVSRKKGGGKLDREAEPANAQLMQKMILTYREKQEQHT